jgi:hypothetical protein
MSPTLLVKLSILSVPRYQCVIILNLYRYCSGDSRAVHEALDRQQPPETEAIMSRSSGHVFATNSTAAVATEDGTPLVKREQGLANSSKSDAVMIPTHESLMAIKHKKKLLTNGTEQFNLKPSKVCLSLH